MQGKCVLEMNVEELFLLNQIVDMHLKEFLSNFPKEKANPSVWKLQKKINELKERDIGCSSISNKKTQ